MTPPVLSGRAITVLICASTLVACGNGSRRADGRSSRSGAQAIAAAPTTTKPEATTTTTTAISARATLPPPGSDVAVASDPVAATPGTVPDPEPLQPQDGTWRVSTASDATSVTVGDDFVVRATISNTGTQPQQTAGYGSFAIACSWADQSMTNPGPESLPIGQFPSGGVVPAGESRTFSVTFRAEPEFVGRLQCGTGIVFHGDAPYANTFGGITIEVVPPADATTTTAVV
jgi:hypothetical protein